MANIEVRSIEDGEITDTPFENVNRWMVDACNRLFIQGDDNKQIAVYADGSWHSAVNVDPEPEVDPQAGPFGVRTDTGYIGHNPAKPAPGPYPGPYQPF